jgi:hypothetical protein
MTLLEFFIGIVVISVLIYLLSLLQYGIEGKLFQDAGNANKESHPSEEQERNIGEANNGSIADAIHAYRRRRETDESDRAKRERVTIVALVATAVFAALAAGTACVSAIIFSGQLGEMHQASVDSGDLVKTARETEEKQLRAYLGIIGDIVLSCYSCNLDTSGPYSHAPQYIMDNTITFNIENGGQTPAYGIYIEDSFYTTEYEGKLPNNFTYPIYSSTEHWAGF